MSKTKAKPERRPSSLTEPRSGKVDAHVQATLDAAVRNGKVSVELKKTTLRLPQMLVTEVQREAHRLTGHKRRGFQTFAAILMQHGWDAYMRGDLKVTTTQRVVEVDLIVEED